MRDRLQRLIDHVRTGPDAHDSALQLRMLVAMAYADDRLGEQELEQLEDFVSRVARGRRDHERLGALLEEYAAAPPSIDEVLDELMRVADRRALGARLVHELTELAGADHAFDHREGVLLDLVCETFGFEPVAFDDEDDDASAVLNELVYRLARAA